jgi:hypothetical protein
MVGVAVQEVGPIVKEEPLIVVAAPDLPIVKPVWFVVPIPNVPVTSQVELAAPDKLRAPAEVRAKVPEVVVDKVRLAEVVPIVEAPKPVAEMLPEVAVRDKAPVVIVNPLEAVKVEENLPVPVTSNVVPGAVFPMPTEPAATSNP